MPVVPLLGHALPQSVGAVPLTVVLTVLVATFLGANAVATSRARALVGTPAGRPGREPARGTSPVDEPLGAAARWTSPGPGTAVGIVLAVLTVVLSVAGPTDAANNLTDEVVLTLGWGALAFVSILLGPVWRTINPANAVSGLLERIAGRGDPRPLSPVASTVVPVALLIGWATAQLLVDLGPTGFGILVIAHLLGHALAAGAVGPRWLEVEPTNVLAGTLGLLRPAGGGPLRRLTEVAPDPRLAWISATLVGWSLVDLLLETERWHELSLPAAAVLPVGLAALVAVVVALGLSMRSASRRLGLEAAFVPVAAGWVVAHYLSLLLVEGQGVPIWLSDPFGTGADLLGRAGGVVDFEPIPVVLLSALQMLPFVAGHLVGVVVATRRAAPRVPSAARLGQATLEVRAVIGILLLGGAWLQLAGL